MSFDAEIATSYQKWYNRQVLLSSVGAELKYRENYEEGEMVTADFKGITLRFPYTEVGTDRCFYALLKAEDLQRRPVRRLFYKLFHRQPRQTTFDTSDPREWEKAVRAELDRMPR